MAVGLLGALIGGGAMLIAAPAAVPAGERARIETVVRDYILKNPEIVTDALRELQAREVGKAVDAGRAALETPYANAWAGNPRGDVTLVEFYDYACGYCRASVPHVERLLKEDPRLRVVYRELPVLGPDSEAAAYASLAAARGARFAAFHKAMFAAGRPDASVIARVAAANGVGSAPTPEAHAEVESNVELARSIGVNGTPAFVVGKRVLSGAVGYEALKAAIAEARAR